MISSRAVMIAGIIGTVLQVAMVLAGHSSPSVAAMFAVGGMSISLVAGVIYGYLVKGPRALGGLIAGGATAGGICAFIGILVSHLMGDVPASLLLLGTLSSVVTGAIGGAIGKISGRAAAVIALIAAAVGTSNASAQVTATTQDFSWLAGRWQGTMTGGPGVADVTFAPPVAGLITGVMRLVSDNRILVVELISIVDTPNGPEMRFRHFSSSLDAYESSFKQAMRLKTHSAESYVFENLVPYDKSLMSTQPRVTTFQRLDADSFTGHSDIIGNDGKPAVVEVKYRRVATF